MMSAHQAEDYTQELTQARKIQMGMLPQSVPEISGFQIAAHSSPAVADNKVFVGADNGNIYSINASNGNLMWSYATGGEITSSPAIANRSIFIGSGDGKIYCMGLETNFLMYAGLCCIVIERHSDLPALHQGLSERGGCLAIKGTDHISFVCSSWLALPTGTARRREPLNGGE